jgi:pimeloyl-ACP methyl ester carboxylesterase
MFEPKKEAKFINAQNTGQYIDLSIVLERFNSPNKEFETRYTMHYHDHGQGHPVVFVHSAYTSSYTFRNSMFHLAEKGFRTIVPDLVGCGFSEKPNLFYSVEDHGIFLEAFINELGLKKVTFCALGEGAAYALDVALRLPDRVDRVVLISPGGINVGYPLGMKVMATFLGRAFSRLFFNPKMMERWLIDAFFDKTKVTARMVKNFFIQFRDPVAKRCLQKNLAHYDDANVIEHLHILRHKALILMGLDDSYHNEEIIEFFNTGIDNAHLMTIRNAGFLLHEEKVSKFNDVLLNFLTWEG